MSTVPPLYSSLVTVQSWNSTPAKLGHKLGLVFSLQQFAIPVRHCCSLIEKHIKAKVLRICQRCHLTFHWFKYYNRPIVGTLLHCLWVNYSKALRYMFPPSRYSYSKYTQTSKIHGFELGLKCCKNLNVLILSQIVCFF